MPALVARYAGRPGLVAAVDAAVRAQQNNDVVVEAAVGVARVLEKVVLVSEGVVSPGSAPGRYYGNTLASQCLTTPTGSSGHDCRRGSGLGRVFGRCFGADPGTYPAWALPVRSGAGR